MRARLWALAGKAREHRRRRSPVSGVSGATTVGPLHHSASAQTALVASAGSCHPPWAFLTPRGVDPARPLPLRPFSLQTTATRYGFSNPMCFPAQLPIQACLPLGLSRSPAPPGPSAVLGLPGTHLLDVQLVAVLRPRHQQVVDLLVVDLQYAEEGKTVVGTHNAGCLERVLVQDAHMDCICTVTPVFAPGGIIPWRRRDLQLFGQAAEKSPLAIAGS